MKDGEQRLVTHYEFKTWPDISVPSNSKELKAFHTLVGEIEPFVCDDKESGKLLIHCGKGWGRSGTLLTYMS